MQKYLFILVLILISGCAQFSEIDKTQFVITDQTVLDKTNDLMWAASDNRQNQTWKEAVDYCEMFDGGGYDDWRMPTIADLQTLMTHQISKENDIIDISSDFIWADETDDSKAAFCHLQTRNCSWMEQAISISLRALPVRDNTTHTDQATTDTAPAVPVIKPQSTTQRLQIIDLLHKQKLITEEEYTRKKAEILDGI